MFIKITINVWNLRASLIFRHNVIPTDLNRLYSHLTPNYFDQTVCKKTMNKIFLNTNMFSRDIFK